VDDRQRPPVVRAQPGRMAGIERLRLTLGAPASAFSRRRARSAHNPQDRQEGSSP